MIFVPVLEWSERERERERERDSGGLVEEPQVGNSV